MNNNQKEKFAGLVAWVVVIGFIALIVVISRVKSSHQTKQESEDKEFIRHPPVEYIELTNRIDQLCCRFECDKNRFKKILDLNSITNVSWFQEAKPLISEAITKVDELSGEIDTLCTDARIMFASNRYAVIEIGLKYDEAMGRMCARDYDGPYSVENLSNLKMLYSLLDRHRSLWHWKNGEFVFSNEELGFKCEILLTLIKTGESTNEIHP